VPAKSGIQNMGFRVKFNAGLPASAGDGELIFCGGSPSGAGGENVYAWVA
jgi:hypothetical protein